MNPIIDKVKWRAEYRDRTEAMEWICAQELAAMTDEQACRIMKLLVVCETPWRPRPDGSGLVEQQAIFHRRSKA